MSKKLDNVRIVTFKEDYFSNARLEEIAVHESKSERPHQVKPIYRKGSKHAIHQRTVNQLREKGAKMDVQQYDYKRAVELAKQAREN